MEEDPLFNTSTGKDDMSKNLEIRLIDQRVLGWDRSCRDGLISSVAAVHVQIPMIQPA